MSHAIFRFVILCSTYVLNNALMTTNTDNGMVQGYRIPVDLGGHLDIYLGIPFAEPPVGDLRFAPPVKRRPWKPHILNATLFGPACPLGLEYLQRNLGGTFANIHEDCLFLNVYAPKNISDPDRLYPVMVWIHGGYFEHESGSVYDGRILASRGEVVVVTPNYRVGAFGFLSTDDSHASGNQALLDQVLALKWVKRNIRFFGGDSEHVTIFGESAGGAAVSLHMFSPLSEGLFQGLITQSGCAYSPFALYRPPISQINNTRSLAKQLGCPLYSSKVMVECLKQKPAEDIVKIEPAHPKLYLAYAPRVDGYFLHDVPENLLRRGQFHRNVRVMSGFVHDESTNFIPKDFDTQGGYDVKKYNSLLDDMSSMYLHSDKVKSLLSCHFPPSVNNSMQNLRYYMQLLSDGEFRAAHIQLASDLAAMGTDTWLYEFSYLSPNYPGPKLRGVYHASELFYVFGAPLFDTVPCAGERNLTCLQLWETSPSWNREDVRISKVLIDIWSDFAKLGRSAKSTTLDLPNGKTWTSFDARQQFLMINSTLEIQNKPRLLSLWDTFQYLNYYANPSNPCEVFKFQKKSLY